MTLREEFDKMEPCADGFNWVSHGKTMSRNFYMLRGEQIVMNCSGSIYGNDVPLIVRAIRYAFGGGISVSYWLMDRVMRINKENTELLKKYGGIVLEGPVYSDFMNVGVPYFSDEDGMLRYISENMFSEIVCMRNDEIYIPDELEEVDKLFDNFLTGTQSAV